METYYVTQEQLDLIEELKQVPFPLFALLNEYDRYKNIKGKSSRQEERALLRYLGRDETIEFKVKEQLYRLWRIDDCGDRTYMIINGFGTPDWTPNKDEAFTAPLEEIKKWKTPAWKIEKVQHG